MNREETDAAENGGRHWKWRLAVVLVFVTGSFFYHIQGNDYPYYYNADEPAKARQVRSRDWNYNHPMAMLSTARLVVNEEMLLQEATERGRAVVAFYTAIGMGFLMGLAWWGFGGAGAIAAAALLLLNPEGYQFARVFKEDPVLFAGMAAFALAAGFWLSRPGGIWNVVALGAGAGLAASSKYIGVYLILLLVVALFWKKGRVPMLGKRLGVGLGVAVGVFLLANLPMLLAPGEVSAALDKEIAKQVEGGNRERSALFQLRVFRTIWYSHDVWQWVWMGAGLVALFWRSEKRARMVVLAALCVGVGYGAIICLAPGYAGRYGMPWSMFVSFFAASGFASVFYFVRTAGWGKRAAVGGLVLVSLLGVASVRMQYRNGLRAVKKDFAEDSHRTMNDWLLKKTGGKASVLQSKQVGLPGTDVRAENEPLPFPPGAEVTTTRFVSDFGSYEELMAADFDYVALGSKEYIHYYEVPKERLAAGEAADEPRSAFYLKLIDDGDWKLVFSTQKRFVVFLHSELYLFQRKR